MSVLDTYARLIALLDEHGAHYRLIGHEPEGRTEVVSPLRGSLVGAAAWVLNWASLRRRRRLDWSA